MSFVKFNCSRTLPTGLDVRKVTVMDSISHITKNVFVKKKHQVVSVVDRRPKSPRSYLQVNNTLLIVSFTYKLPPVIQTAIKPCTETVIKINMGPNN